jgi:hypothetical protein
MSWWAVQDLNLRPHACGIRLDDFPLTSVNVC